MNKVSRYISICISIPAFLFFIEYALPLRIFKDTYEGIKTVKFSKTGSITYLNFKKSKFPVSDEALDLHKGDTVYIYKTAIFGLVKEMELRKSTRVIIKIEQETGFHQSFIFLPILHVICFFVFAFVKDTDVVFKVNALNIILAVITLFFWFLLY